MAEGLPAVMNAVTVISEAVASMPCYLYRVQHQNGKEFREWLSDHPVDYLLNECPNDCQTPYQFKRTLMRHCLLNGNAYAVIVWGGIRTTQGDCIDYDRIRDDILKDSQHLDIKLVGFDTWNATHLRTQLQGAGLDVEPFPRTPISNRTRRSPRIKSTLQSRS
ncbi:hypothetical protein XBJ2_2080021 [Xenorhabdus bovienii str. Jollieti]|uniref:Phage protein n=1 Tax=Xenorhabdus bovienii (strain SS-2004) TaxID=406818 RepID=D3V6F0_XENBS|nr:hypothetical protein XBJ1_4117 [Xenorhabdus bovienii SS-2004]CDH28941.1 hypothetical protein XBJ2_2080021 [Xenorhabdus bovienii str. Jollieti]